MAQTGLPPTPNAVQLAKRDRYHPLVDAAPSRETFETHRSGHPVLAEPTTGASNRERGELAAELDRGQAGTLATEAQACSIEVDQMLREQQRPSGPQQPGGQALQIRHIDEEMAGWPEREAAHSMNDKDERASDAS